MRGGPRVVSEGSICQVPPLAKGETTASLSGFSRLWFRGSRKLLGTFLLLSPHMTQSARPAWGSQLRFTCSHHIQAEERASGIVGGKKPRAVIARIHPCIRTGPNEVVLPGLDLIQRNGPEM